MEIKWHKTNKSKFYPYLLEDYYLQIYVNRDEQVTICSVTIEHPKTWNKELNQWDIDFANRMVIVKHNIGSKTNTELIYNFSDLNLAQNKITEIIRVAKNKIVSQIDEASKNLPV